MRPSFRLFALAALASFVVACGSDPDLKDTRPRDGSVSEVIATDAETGSEEDTGEAPDTNVDDVSMADSTIDDTGMLVTDTGVVVTDTGSPADTFMPPVDTGTVDTSVDTFMPPPDTGTIDSSTDTFMPPPDTGTIDSSMDTFMPPPDTGTIDSSMDTFMPPPDTGTIDSSTDTFMPPPDTGTIDSSTDTFMPPPDTGTIDTSFDTFTPPPDSGDGADTFVMDSFTLETALDDTSLSLDGASASTDGSKLSTAFSHTISIDGVNDFTAQEQFATTSGGYTAYVTWDASYVYIGYRGADVGTSASGTKWVMAYFDTASSGATSTEQNNSQKHLFSSSFAADAYFAWKTDGSFQQLKTYSGGAWSTVSTIVATNKSGDFVEMAIPRSAIGATTKLGVSTFMIEEAGGSEWTFAGLYTASFMDGYSSTGAPKTLMRWLDADPALLTAPNDPSRQNN